jgi:capsular exopolysaccharide synthesis family protein
MSFLGPDKPVMSLPGGVARQAFPAPRAADVDTDGPNLYAMALEAVKTHALLVTLLSFLGAGVGFFVFLSLPSMYRSTTTIELQGFNEGFMNLNQIDPQAGTGSYSPTQLNISTQLRIIESAALRSAVVQRLSRETAPMLPATGGWIQAMRARLGIGEDLDPLDATRRAIEVAAKNVTARSVTGTRIIAVTVSSTAPEVAASFANALAAEFIAQGTQQRTGSVQRMSQWLEGQLADTQYRLAQSEAKLQDFIRQSGAIFVGDSDTLAQSKLKQLQSELAAIQADRIAKQSRYEMVTKAPPDTLPEVLDDAALRSYQTQIANLRRERALLLTTLTPQNPKVMRVDAQIAELEKALEKERENIVTRIRNEYDAARRREQMLMSAYVSQSGAVVSQADKAAEYNLLKREVDTLRAYMNSLLQQANQASVAAALPTTSIRVIDEAQPAATPYSPDPVYATGIGLALGLGLGWGTGFLRVLLRKRREMRSFAAPGHSMQVLEVPELGVIPSADLAARRRWALPFSGGLLPKGGNDSEADRGELAPMGQQPAALLDSFRLIFASLTIMKRQGYSPRTIMVTSGGPGEGKTTVMSNLALVMAEAHHRVILVDADLRKPRLHTLFGLDNERGFADLIDGSDPVHAAAVNQLLRPTRLPGLSVLTSGSPRDIADLHHLLYSPRVVEVLNVLRGQADMVLIDAPPMLHFFESRLLARLTDGVILVIRAGTTDRFTALECRQKLAQDNVPLLGTVLNDWDPGKFGYGSPEYHSAYYRYYAEERKK